MSDSTRRRRLLLAVLCTGMFLVLLDVTVVNVALPAMAGALHTGLPALQGVVDGYAVVFAGLLLGAGGVGDRLGHRQTVLLGLTLFGLASLGCGLAPVPAALIAARAVQGAGAAFLLPGSLAVLTRAYPHKAEQSKALGIWAAISSIALPAGPILGGALVDTIGWRWVFLVNLPVVVAAFVGVLTLVSPALAAPASAAATGTAQLGSAPADADVSTTAPRLDPAGMVLVPLTLGALVWSVIAAGQWLPVAVAVAAAGALVLAERRAKAPLLPHGLLNRAEVLSPNAIAFVMNVVTNGTLLIVTLFLQQVRGFSALNAGFLLLFLALPLAGLAAVSGRLTATFGPRLPAVVGVLLGAAGALTLGTIEPRGGFGWMLAGLVALGAGDGFIVTAAVAAAMQAMPPAHAGLAGGLNNTARQLGTAFGVAVFGAVSGPATEAGHFVRHVHRLAWIGAAAWLVALALTRWIGRAQEATTASRRKISQPTAS